MADQPTPPDAGLDASPAFDTFFGDNPYPQNDPLHHAWITMNRLAVEETARINATAAAARPGRDASDAAHIDHLTNLVVARFDLRARSLLPFVIASVSDNPYAGAERYKALMDWLQGWVLDQLQVLPHSPALTAPWPELAMTAAHQANVVTQVNARLLAAVQLRLDEQKAYWWLQACTMAREQEEQRAARQRAQERPAPQASAGITGNDRPASEALKERRRALIDAFCDANGFTTFTQLCESKLHIHPSALTAMIRDDRNKYSAGTLRRVLTTLNISIEDWTRDPS